MIAATVDERDIYRAIVRFARAMDERDWAAIERIALPEATGDLGAGELPDRTAMIALMRRYLDGCGPTQHMVANVLIDVSTGDGADGEGDTAESRAYVSDLHLGTGALVGEYFRTLGDYHDSWVRVDGEWRMARRVKHMSGTLGTQAVFGAGHAARAPEPGPGTNPGPSTGPDENPVSAITTLLYRYAEHIDTGRLEDAAELFRHAAVRLGRGSDGKPYDVDADALLKVWRSTVKLHEDGTPRTKHVITNPIVEVDLAAGTARSRSYYTVFQATSHVPLQPIASGRYHDGFELAGGRWRFTFRDYSRMDFTGNMSDHLRDRR